MAQPAMIAVERQRVNARDEVSSWAALLWLLRVAVCNLYITQPSLSRIDKLSPEGRLLGQIKVPENPSNCTFGGDDMKTLFITARTSVYTLDCDVAGHRVVSTGDAKTGISSTVEPQRRRTA